jgi:two-component system, OmpR family, alkaline phosphatase synthesis response regulator PhoP
MKPLIFSVEDDLNIQNVFNIALQNSNFAVEIFDDAEKLFNRLKVKKPDLFLLDIMLPDMDGIEIIKKIKKDPNLKNIPIMVVSAKISEVDKVIGLETGADDYLVKPFGVLELVSRVKALLRRAYRSEEGEILQVGELKLDTSNRECKYKDNSITFTKKQFELLEYLIRNHLKIVTREELLQMIWGYSFIGESRTLDVHIKDIRKKLKEAGLDKKAIETVRGVGYKLIL